MKTTTILWIIFYIIGTFLSLWRYFTWVCNMREIEEQPMTFRQEQVTFMFGVFITLLSWFGLIGGTLSFWLDEDDNTYFKY